MHVGPRRRSLSSLRHEAAVMTHTMRCCIRSSARCAAGPVPSSTLMAPMTTCFVDTIKESYAEREGGRRRVGARASSTSAGRRAAARPLGTGAAGGWPRGRVAARGAPLTTTMGNMGADGASATALQPPHLLTTLPAPRPGRCDKVVSLGRSPSALPRGRATMRRRDVIQALCGLLGVGTLATRRVRAAAPREPARPPVQAAPNIWACPATRGRIRRRRTWVTSDAAAREGLRVDRRRRRRGDGPPHRSGTSITHAAVTVPDWGAAQSGGGIRDKYGERNSAESEERRFGREGW